MGDIISLNDCRDSRQDNWRAGVKARFSITRLDTGWLPPNGAQLVARGLLRQEPVDPFFKHFGQSEV